MTQPSKYPLPIILGLVFGSLSGIILLACIITYILIKQGHIRTGIKDIERTRIIDSSSSTVDASLSRR